MEGIFAYQQIGFTLVEKSFAVPTVRGGKSRATTLQLGGRGEQLTRGQRLWYAGAGYLVVSRIRSDRAVDVYSTGESCNAPAGTLAPGGRILSMPRGFPNPKAEIANNVIDGGIVTGSPDLQIGRPGIRVDEMQITITHNQITALTGIMLNGSAAFFPALVTQTGSIISDNIFHLPDASAPYLGKAMPTTRGLENYQPGVTVQNNTVLLSTNKNASGLLVSAPDVRVLNNKVSARATATKGIPSVGVFIGDLGQMAADQVPKVEGNSFSLLDIGIGTTPGQLNTVFVGPGNSYSEVVVPIQTTGLKVTGPGEAKPH